MRGAEAAPSLSQVHHQQCDHMILPIDLSALLGFSQLDSFLSCCLSADSARQTTRGEGRMGNDLHRCPFLDAPSLTLTPKRS